MQGRPCSTSDDELLHSPTGVLIMLKIKVQRIIQETCEGENLDRDQKFQIFCNVCDNLLREGRISEIQHERWTEAF